VARGLCGLLRPFGAVVFTFDRPGRGELVLEDLEQAHGRIALWVEANRNAIEVVKPLEDALMDGDDPIQGMVGGQPEPDARGRAGGQGQRMGRRLRVRADEYPARDLSILDLLPRAFRRARRSSGWRLTWAWSATR
jgi:hypothetical protein